MKPSEVDRYHKWIREQPCMECGAVPSDVSHYVGMSGSELGKGIAQRSSHLLVAPHCRSCHERVEAREMWNFHDDQFVNRLSHSEGMLVHIGKTLIKAIDEGVLNVS